MTQVHDGFFSDRFAELKLDTKIDRAEDEARWLLDFLPPRPVVSDLGCGCGRISIALAKQGANVIGVDSNAGYLEIARQRARTAGVAVEWRCATDLDMSDVAAFDGVVSLFTSFGYHDDDGTREVLRKIHRGLRPAGLLVIETQNRDHASVWTVSATVERTPDGTEILKEYEFDPLTSRKTIRFRYLRDNKITDGGRLKVRLFSAHELMIWLSEAGFCVEGLYGNSRGATFDPTGEKLVAVARKVDG